MTLHIEVHRTDGDVGYYSIGDPDAALAWLKSLEPRRLFRHKTLLVAGENSISLINTDTVAWLSLRGEVVSEDFWLERFSFGFKTSGEQIFGRAAFLSDLELASLAWQKSESQDQSFTALGELLFKGGLEFYARISADSLALAEQNALLSNFFQLPVLRIGSALGGLHLLNPQALSRARFYTRQSPRHFPLQTIFAEPREVRPSRAPAF